MVDWTAPLSVLFPPVQGGVLYALWQRPVPMTGRQVHKVAATGSYTGTLAALARLVDQGLVDARQAGQASEYTLNTEHVLYPVLDGALGSFSPHERLRRQLKDLVHDHLPDRASEVSLAFFGSYARRQATVSSDLDLLLVLPEDLDQEVVDRLIGALEHQGRRWSGNAVQVYATTPTGLRRAIEANDPIVESWKRDATTVIGADIQHLLRQLQRTAP